MLRFLPLFAGARTAASLQGGNLLSTVNTRAMRAMIATIDGVTH
jgi:hypothetical protein